MTAQAVLTAAIDTTADTAGVALFEGGNLLSELTWYSRLSHSRDLLPCLDWLLQRAGRTKSELGRIVVCTGPGSYAGMRVGVSTAKTLAYGLGAALIGVNRLEADALAFAGSTAGRIVALHAAGRAELAWAAYTGDADGLHEVEAPQLTPTEALPGLLHPDDLAIGDLASLPAGLQDALTKHGVQLAATHPSRVVNAGRIGIARLEAGQRDDPDSLAPLYLRAPAIGPQPPISGQS